MAKLQMGKIVSKALKGIRGSSGASGSSGSSGSGGSSGASTYKVYKAFLSLPDRGGSIIADVVENTLGGELVWGRREEAFTEGAISTVSTNLVNWHIATLQGAFPNPAKVAVLIPHHKWFWADEFEGMAHDADTVIFAGSYVNPNINTGIGLTNRFIEIRVYP